MQHEQVGWVRVAEVGWIRVCMRHYFKQIVCEVRVFRSKTI